MGRRLVLRLRLPQAGSLIHVARLSLLSFFVETLSNSALAEIGGLFALAFANATSHHRLHHREPL
jgi:hypothetical protein